jgi:ABC-type multidrug transport system fused ATPase/permease subunit
MFDGTVAENIRFSRPAATMEQVKAVSVIAHCDEFIERFPNKYETIVGNGASSSPAASASAWPSPGRFWRIPAS